MAQRLDRLRKFLVKDIWRDVPAPSRLKAMGLQVVRVATLAVRNFSTDQCLMRATALAYVTLLSLVPLLAFAFSILKGMGVQEKLKPLILTWVAAGQQEVVLQFMKYVEDTNFKAVGAIGLLFLIWTTISVLGTIETSLNEIWGVKRTRTFYRKFTDYVSVVVTAPILLAAAMSLTTALESGALPAPRVGHVLLKVAPYVGTWIAFAAVYILMPNMKVRYRSALLGGFVGGTLWQLAFWGYTVFQIGMARSNAIYGTFAAIPFFMVWLYMSWAIVLFGAEVSCAVQSVGRFWDEQRAAGISYAAREAVALRAMISIALAFFRDGRPLGVSEIAAHLKVPSRLVRDVVQALVATGLCVEVIRDDANGYQPARDLEAITPAQVVAALRSQGEPVEMNSEGLEASIVKELIEGSGEIQRAGLGSANLREIAARVASGASPPPPQK
jgi:membrane protein